MKPRLLRTAFIVVGLLLWFWTQSLLSQRPAATGTLGDAVHQWTASWNAALHAHPQAANALLAISSGFIDALGIFLFARAIFGASIRPFLGLLILFAMRQICQALCSLPEPPGMIWRNPGFPSLLVTYGVSTDFFFSGHTAIAVYGALELARLGSLPLKIFAVALALFEATIVLVLRAHYTLDVIGGALAVFIAAQLAQRLAPACDAFLNRLAGKPTQPSSP